MKVLITGATGLIGHELGKELIREGHQLIAISRNEEKAKADLPFPCEVIAGDLQKEAVTDARLAGVQAVIHLMGESVGEGRWTAAKKKRIVDSRVKGTAHLIESLKKSGCQNIAVFLSASAIGFYGDRGEEVMTDEATAGSDFLADVCVQWERAVDAVKDSFPQARVGKFRFGIVISPFGGALKKMLTPFRVGLGACLGSGRQWMSWIDLSDICGVLSWALTESRAEGVFNTVAPEPVRNRDFSKSLAAAFGKGLGPSVPRFALKLAVGEMSEMLLASQRVKPQRLRELGYKFRAPDLDSVFEKVASFFRNGEMLLRAEQYLPATRDRVFPFFADARNLEKITPQMLHFQITGVSTPEVRSGTLIDYRLKIHGVPVKWRTRIDEWSPSEKFVDTQLQGPYRKWHHTHRFENLGAGTLMTDMVRYQVPFGWLGWFASGWMVSRDIDGIFRYRRDVCAKQNFDSLDPKPKDPA